jgi:3',5'-cyclic AMP phosphodiesterase CpdA
VFPTVVVVGAGDIGDCSNDSGRWAEATARLIDRNADATVLALGDLAYMDGSAERFANCYASRWGRHRNRTYPTPGNHEYVTLNAAPYYTYFGNAAGEYGSGFYSFDLGGWHIISLNSNIADDSGSLQFQWLREDLAASNKKCQLAYWHHPTFSSSLSGGGFMKDAWRLLQDFGAEVVLTAHDHGYERFAPQMADGRRDERGIQQFVVGTGGAPLYGFMGHKPNSDRQVQAYGIIRLALHSNSYDYGFIDVNDATQDSGSGIACH